MDIEIKNKRNIVERIIQAIYENQDVVYKGRYIINHIGGTLYIDFDFLRTLNITQIETLFSKILR